MSPNPIQLIEYQDHRGRIPFREWLDSLRDVQTQATIDARLTRVRRGNFGNCRSVGGGIQELKIDIGPGFRVYFGREGNDLVLLLCGGDKRSQSTDITRAKLYWADYKEHD